MVHWFHIRAELEGNTEWRAKTVLANKVASPAARKRTATGRRRSARSGHHGQNFHRKGASLHSWLERG